MTETRHRFTGDKLVFEFAIELAGIPHPVPTATLQVAVRAPDGSVIPGAAAWLSAPDDHVVQCEIPEGATSQPGKHEFDMKLTDPTLAEPVRGRVFVKLQDSAI